MEKIFELEELIFRLERDESYFLTFLSSQGIDAGILRLQPEEEDVQEPHIADEIYFILRGDGFIRINDRKYELKRNSFIYVPANVEHKFYGNKEELLVAYFLAN
jgi:mannose-6-phosphate isomerase-like protein (cupin superfamily)